MSAKTAAKSQDTVQSVQRALELLEAVASSKGLGVVELSNRVGLRPSTAHRLLATLIACGYVVKDPHTNHYRLSLKVVELAGDAEHRLERLTSVVRPFLEAITRETDETANLTVLDRFTVVYVDQVESSRAVRMFTSIGRHVPAHACASGKAILAHRARADLAELVSLVNLEPLTKRTITTEAALVAELDRVRKRGYAIDNEEFEDGVVCVAAPIDDPSSQVLAALSVSGPAARMRQHRLDELGALVAQQASAASSALSWDGV